MRIPARFAPVLFSALLSAIMVAIMVAFVLLSTQGLQPDFLTRWAKSCITTWPVAFAAVTLVAPWVRGLVAKLTA